MDEILELLHLDPKGDVVVHQLALEQRESAEVTAHSRLE